MKAQENINFDRIAEAIGYLKSNFQQQPGLDEVAEKVHLSPFHFQRMFTEWAGVSPKKFLQYLSVEHARKVLHDSAATLFDAAYETGLSGTGRLHDLFVAIESMTPGEYKNGGENLHISYSYAQSPFGPMLIAATPKGICHMAFADDPDAALSLLKEKFPRAAYREERNAFHEEVLSVFSGNAAPADKIRLHLKGTPFQLKVWEALLRIPAGGLSAYGAIAGQISHPGASRAVGSAIGSNPVAYLIPCHRVIQSGGILGGYHWGRDRKAAMIGWEAIKANM